MGRTEISECTPPPKNSLVTALPGLVPIFVSAGGMNALAGVLFKKISTFYVLRPRSHDTGMKLMPVKNHYVFNYSHGTGRVILVTTFVHFIIEIRTLKCFA